MSGEIESTCIKPAKQLDGGIFIDTGINERKMNDAVKMTVS